MHILVFNCGSATLKFRLFDLAEGAPLDHICLLVLGKVDRIGQQAHLEFRLASGQTLNTAATVRGYADAVRLAIDQLSSQQLLDLREQVVVGHRIVHGGWQFFEPVLLDNEGIGAIEEASKLAPLHNKPALEAIGAARQAMGGAVPMVAVFDTAFHHRLPDVAAQYAIPRDLANRHHVRRYGFHGLAHRFMMERYAQILGRPAEALRLITLQLGSGCSVAAIAEGRSVDTSMGFTPLEGLMMSTRSGDLDPALVGYLASQESVPVAKVEEWLNHESGLLGVSGRSADMRDLLEAQRQGDASASLAVDMFCYRARKYIGAYLAVLGGADAVLFGGGIGEHAPEVRARICSGMEWCGLALDDVRNAHAVGIEANIATTEAGIGAYVMPVDEELVIARETARYIRTLGQQ
ncbi:MAG: acetate kinase [Dehalococcoidia bacterium]|nr:acetate kinase [Dehalococcoidia bacterium]